MVSVPLGEKPALKMDSLRNREKPSSQDLKTKTRTNSKLKSRLLKTKCLLKAVSLTPSEDTVWAKFLRKKEKTFDLTGTDFIWLVRSMHLIFGTCFLFMLLGCFHVPFDL